MRKKALFLFAVFFVFLRPVFGEGEFQKTSLFDIELNPSEFYEKNVQVQAYFYKESNIWADSLPESSRYIGVFVTKPTKDVASFQGEYFGFIFAPKELKVQIRLLKSGDKITIRGKCFEFKSISIDGPGIEASQILSGWGEEAKPLEAPLSPVRETIKKSVAGTEKFSLFLNGKEYQGLRYGDDYLFEGVRFRAERERSNEK